MLVVQGGCVLAIVSFEDDRMFSGSLSIMVDQKVYSNRTHTVKRVLQPYKQGRSSLSHQHSIG